MIEYIYRTSIDETIMQKTKDILLEGGLIAYPTDTSWGIGCSINSKKGIEKLKKLKGNYKSSTLTLICSSISQISEIAFLNNSDFRLLNQLTPGPYVFILKATKKIEKKVNMKRIEIGVRIPDHPVPVKIVETLGSPIFSTTALKNLTEQHLNNNYNRHLNKNYDRASTNIEEGSTNVKQGWLDKKYAEEYLFECGWELEYINQVDLILDTGETLDKVLSTVIDMTGPELKIVRMGIGDVSQL